VKPFAKFGLLVVAIVGILVWLAAGGIKETKTYYKTITELQQMGDRAKTSRIRVGGDVEVGSIQRLGKNVLFTLTQDNVKLKVVYSGTDPLPDTFRDGSQALADGKLGTDGVFHASKIQAKCASKYEAKPPAKPGAALNRAAM
jgi:cytochrome c-type biogenesis protein CcmE